MAGGVERAGYARPMVRRLWWLLLASLVFGAVAFVARSRRGGCATGVTTEPGGTGSNPAWPPITDDDGTTAEATGGRVATDRTTDLRSFVAVAEPATEAPAWVLPVDGRCPDGYPIKANDNSRIFHVPGGRFYDRTVPERCYAEGAAALADGYRAAKA